MDRPAFGVVVGHRPDQGQLQARHALARLEPGADQTERVLPGIEARYLDDQRSAQIDAEAGHDPAGEVARQRAILRRQRVDRRRDDRHLLAR